LGLDVGKNVRDTHESKNNAWKYEENKNRTIAMRSRDEAKKELAQASFRGS
jgi:hypothetical protein